MVVDDLFIQEGIEMPRASLSRSVGLLLLQLASAAGEFVRAKKIRFNLRPVTLAGS